MELEIRQRFREPEYILAVLAVVGLLVFPHVVNIYYQFVIVSAAFLGIFAATYDFFSGLTGYFSFAHMVLVGVGGYSSAILAQKIGVPLLLAIVVATLLTAVVGLVVIGVPSLRLSGLYFVIISVVIASIAAKLVTIYSGWTGGQDGFLLVPSLMSEIEPLLPFELAEPLVKYYLAVLLLIAVATILLVFSKSRLGIILASMQQDETLLRAIGIDPVKFRLVGFGITSLFTGFAAAVWTHTLTSLNPRSHIAFASMIDIIIAMVLGGAGTIVGPIIGVFALAGFEELLIYVNSNSLLFAGVDIDLNVFQRIITMGVVLVFVYYVPEGIYPKFKGGLHRVKDDGLNSFWKSLTERVRTKLSSVGNRLK